MHRTRLNLLLLLLLAAAATNASANPFFGADQAQPGRSRSDVSPRDGDVSPEDGAVSPEDGDVSPEEAEVLPGEPAAAGWIRSAYARTRQRIIGFQRSLNNDLAELIADAGEGSASLVWVVVLMSFLYGIAHAVLPGHRKTVIISYYLTEDARPVHGIGAGFAFALMHVISAVLVVALVMATVQAATMRAIGDATGILQRVSSLLIIAIGLVLLTRKILAVRASREQRIARSLEDSLGLSSGGALSAHVARTRVSSLWPVIVAAGLVPCPVTTSVLLFSISFGVLSLGVIAVVALSAGLGIALSVIALITILFKERILLIMQRLTGRSWQHVIEFIGAGSILVFGLITLFVTGGFL